MRWTVGWIAAVLGFGLSGCSLVALKPPPPLIDGTQVGVASWYGPGFHGRRAANGEIFDQFQLTAAHKTLPLGSRAIVTNLANGRAVEVRITDRGPFVGARVIDLSYAAARMVEMIGPGTATVRIDVLASTDATAGKRRPAAIQVASREPTSVPKPDSAPATIPASASRPTRQWLVQVAAFGDPAKADHLREVLAARFPETTVATLDTAERRFYRVAVGPYTDRDEAVARATRITRLGYPALLSEEPHP